MLDFCVGFLCWIFVLEKDLENVLENVLVPPITILLSTLPICSVMATKDYILQVQPPANCPLFMSSQSGSWLTHSSFTKELRSTLQKCGFSSTIFYSHSFRIGAATSAALVTACKLWNSLPLTTRKLCTLGSFKKSLWKNIFNNQQVLNHVIL